MTVRAIFFRGVLLAALWCILTEGSLNSWGLGVISVAAALVASLALLPPGSTRFSFAGLATFLVFFVSQSLLAGIRVALLVFAPRLNIQPGVVRVHLRLPEGASRVILVNTLNLLPGTLVVKLDGNNLYLHALNIRGSAETEVHLTETRIAKMLGLSLEEA